MSDNTQQYHQALLDDPRLGSLAEAREEIIELISKRKQELKEIFEL